MSSAKSSSRVSGGAGGFRTSPSGPTRRHNSTSGSSKSSAGQSKRSIENDGTTPLSFLCACLMFVFRRFVFSPTHIKIGIYFMALVIGSLMKDFNLVYKSPYFTNKSNVFNAYFVKLGWFWTLLVTMPFMVMTSIVYTGCNQVAIRNNLFRLVVATGLWFVWTKLFDYIDTNTGSCMSPLHRDKLGCKLNKHEWIGFDISGHTFILMHALLLMLEEVKVYHQWDNMRKKIRDNIHKHEKAAASEGSAPFNENNINGLSSSSELLIDRATYWYLKLNNFIKLNFFLMAMLALLWEMMLFITFIYYHTIMHKLIAGICAIISWFLTYKVWYANKDLFMSPGLPGSGIERLSSVA